MAFIKRTAYIKFITKDKFTITNFAKSKEFTITRPTIIDLVTLESVHEDYMWGLGPYPFFGFFEPEETSTDDYVAGLVVVQTSEDNAEEVGEINYKDKEKQFVANVWVEK